MSTLRDMLERRDSLTAFCQNWQPDPCRHSGPVRLEAAVQRFGWDFDPIAGRQAFLARLRCSVCGATFPHIILHPYQATAHVAGTSHHPIAQMGMEEAARLDIERRREWAARDLADGVPPGPRGRFRQFGVR